MLGLGAPLEVDEEEAAGQPEGAVEEQQQEHLHTAAWVILLNQNLKLHMNKHASTFSNFTLHTRFNTAPEQPRKTQARRAHIP